MELQARRGVQVSAETVRHWLHELGWVWKRAKLAAKDDDPQRMEKLARIRYTVEHLPARAALFFADELDISLLPKVGYPWMPKGEQLEVPRGRSSRGPRALYADRPQHPGARPVAAEPPTAHRASGSGAPGK